MADEIVKVEDQSVRVSLGGFALNLRQRAVLYRELGAGMMVSVRRTFRDQGSPADSWAPLAASTLRNPASKASAGRKILIVSGRLLNSIHAEESSSGVVVGTNLVYARVQQEGSADHAGSANGPQARIVGRSAHVGSHSRSFLREIHYGTREVAGKDGKSHHVPAAMRTGMRDVEDKRGRTTKVRAAYQGPRLQQDVSVAEHERFQNIRARPYLVFRPEDLPRIRAQVATFEVNAALQAGLNAGGAR
jgi:phage gpG-like protein